MHLADAVDRDARAEDDPALLTELGDLGDHRNRAVRGQPGRVDPEFAEPREAVEHDPRDLDHVVARGRLAPRQVGDFDVLPEVRLERAFDFRERHVRLAIAAFPVAAHFTTGVADERAMVDEDGGMDRSMLRDVRIDEVSWCAGGGLQKILCCVSLCHGICPLYLMGHQLTRFLASGRRTSAFRRGFCEF